MFNVEEKLTELYEVANCHEERMDILEFIYDIQNDRSNCRPHSVPEYVRKCADEHIRKNTGSYEPYG